VFEDKLFETKANARQICPRVCLGVKASHRGPHPWTLLTTDNAGADRDLYNI